jgi:hypothetical protein
MKRRLREVYAAYLDSVARVGDPGYGTTTQGLIVNRYNGADDKWSAPDAMNLHYCISTTSFGLNYATAVLAMNTAAQAWKNVAQVNLIHDVLKDPLCDSTTAGVTFDVLQTANQPYIARAFFPSYPRAARKILIDQSGFGNLGQVTLTGVLRHELGHVLGFRHEHTRPEAGTCFEDNNWRSLTTYDAKSVMHYPHCNGTQTGDLTLTTYDIGGATALYPWPQPALSFRTATGHFLVSEFGGGAYIAADRTAIGSWERFVYADLNGGGLAHGDPINLRAADGTHWVAQGGGGGALNVNSAIFGPYETFRILNLDGWSDFLTGDRVAIQASNGQYVVAEGGGGGGAGSVNANRSAIGPWETFVITLQ